MYTYEISTELAQKIVKSIMEIVPYNINIMNKSGVIIGSGETERISKIHEGAIVALNEKRTVIIYKDTDKVKRGVNLPIYYMNEVVGIIGISGDPDKLLQIGKVISVTAELMIDNIVKNNIAIIKAERLNDFMYDWIHFEHDVKDKDFLNRADEFKIDISKPRVVVLITLNKTRFSVVSEVEKFIREGEYVSNHINLDVVLLLRSEFGINDRLNKILDISDDFINCFVGTATENINDSYQQVLKLRENFEKSIYQDKIIKYEDNIMFSAALSIKDHEILQNVKAMLSTRDKNGELSETIKAYFLYNCDIDKTCKVLHIHRNTLNYRLAKIEECTNKNPRNMNDLFILFATVHNTNNIK